MKSFLKYVSTLNSISRNHFLGAGRKRRGRRAAAKTNYQCLEKRDLLTTFTVTTLQDVVADDGLVSLREAITAANTNAAFGDAAAGDTSGDVIAFAPELANGTIQLTAGEVEINDDLTIIGNGGITIDAQGQSRIFSLYTNQTVQLAGLTFANGRTGFDGGAIAVFGGDLQISNSQFNSSAADWEGGAIFGFESSIRIGRTTFNDNLSGNRGGAVGLAGGSLKLFQSTFEGNRADVGGAISTSGRELFVSESTFRDNLALLDTDTLAGSDGLAGGGAIHAISPEGEESLVLISDSEIIDNAAVSGGGGISLGPQTTAFVTAGTRIIGNFGVNPERRDLGGGGIYTEGNLFVSDSTISSNVIKSGGGGGIFSKGDGSSQSILRLTNTIVSRNLSAESGAGISADGSNVTVINSEILNNRIGLEVTNGSPLSGGGLYVKSADQRGLGIEESSVVVRDSLFEGNVAKHRGGGLATDGASLSIVGSTFRNNVVFAEDLPRDFQLTEIVETIGGGGVFHSSNSVDSDPGSTFGKGLVVSNSRFEQNRLISGGNLLRFTQDVSAIGGGLATVDSNARILSSTFGSNTSDGHGGGLGQSGASTLSIVESDFTENRAGRTGIQIANGLGGGVYSQTSVGAEVPQAVGIFGADFDRNIAFESGGGLYTESANPQITLLVRTSNSDQFATFTGNRALRQDGGAIAANNVRLNVFDVILNDNSARDGGGIFSEGGTELILSNGFIIDNTARRNGGAVSLIDTEFRDLFNAFGDNSATNGPDVFEA